MGQEYFGMDQQWIFSVGSKGLDAQLQQGQLALCVETKR